ncbi:hypothetical protein PG985_005728 [Apiospora marii]|uniref:uncharacterized protein n=1 Tax=Apiospora marii TaxID=335849 RepID=UPI003131AFA4
MDSNFVDRLIFRGACHTSRGRLASAVFLFICALSCAVLLRLWRRRIQYGNLEADLEKNTSHHISLVLLGDACVGKSTLVARFLRHKPESKSEATIEDIYHFTLKGGDTVKLTDTAGVDLYPSLRNEAIRKADCFMLVFDVRDRNSFVYLEAVIASVQEERKNVLPMLFVGNRASERGDRVITKKEGEKLALKFGGEYMEVSDDQEYVGDVFSAASSTKQKPKNPLEKNVY